MNPKKDPYERLWLSVPVCDNRPTAGYELCQGQALEVGR